MGNDRRWLILENIKDAFALITTAGGYNFTVGYQDIGVKDIPEIPADKFPALMVMGANEDRENVTNEHFRSVMDVSIAGYIRSSNPRDAKAAEEELSALIADVTKALYVDHTRGGNCRYTEIGKIDTDQGLLASFAAFKMIVQVEYRSDFATP